MQISSKTKSEDILIQYFVKDGPTIHLAGMELGADLGTSPFAVSAMLKGFEEFYLKPAGKKIEDQELALGMAESLAAWAKMQAEKTEPSRLIIP